ACCRGLGRPERLRFASIKEKLTAVLPQVWVPARVPPQVCFGAAFRAGIGTVAARRAYPPAGPADPRWMVRVDTAPWRAPCGIGRAWVAGRGWLTELRGLSGDVAGRCRRSRRT